MFRPLRYVMNFIPKSVQEAEQDTEQILSWALQAVRSVEHDKLYMNRLDILQVHNHGVCLPSGLKKIKHIKMLVQTPTDEELESIKQAITYDTYKEAAGDLTDKATESFTGYTIYHQLLLNSDYWKNNWIPMKFVGYTDQKNFFSSECWTIINGEECKDCFNEFSITPGGCLTTEAKEGYIVIIYESELKDKDGNFLFPDKPIELWRAMGEYVKARHWENRIGYHEQNAMNLAERYDMRYYALLHRAKSILRQMSLSYRDNYEILFGDIAITKLPVR